MIENKFMPLEEVTKPILTTEEASYYLNRKPQTLRAWSCKDDGGVLVSINISGRLAWKTSDVKKLLGI